MIVSSLAASGPLVRPDLLDPNSPGGLEIIQLTTDPNVSACHISMEAQVCTPDSCFVVLHRGVGVQSYDHKDPSHQLQLCQLDSLEVVPLTDEVGVVAPSVSPDGRFLYYFVDETSLGGGRLTLRRRNLDGSDLVTLCVLDTELPGTRFRFSRPGHLSTIRSDGRSLALYGFLGDGRYGGGAFGLLIFDLVCGGVDLIFHGRSFFNMHIQYCRSTDAEASHDIMIQENHGSFIDPAGMPHYRGWGWGADIHLIRDDGQHLRNLPWGRVAGEKCSGHQCWRGTTPYAIGSLVTGSEADLRQKRSELRLMESLPIPHAGHHGARVEGAVRNEISREIRPAHFNHFATSSDGRRLVADSRICWDPDIECSDAIFLMELGEPGVEAAREVKYLFSPHSSWLPKAHVHPFLSPDGRTLFFNSDESGQTQAYLARNLPAPP